MAIATDSVLVHGSGLLWISVHCSSPDLPLLETGDRHSSTPCFATIQYFNHYRGFVLVFEQYHTSALLVVYHLEQITLHDIPDSAMTRITNATAECND